MSPQSLSLSEIRRRLGAHTHRRLPAEGIMKKAAVAAVLRETDDPADPHAEVLLIRRAEHPKDPWSGHMALPGGRVDPEDKDELEAAIRETREELGLDLRVHGTQIGELSHLVAMAHGRPLPMIIVPFVFALQGPSALSLNDEVQEALWVPLFDFLRPENRSVIEKTFAGVSLNLPCCSYEGRVIWGLTLRMIDELLEIVSGE